jgi:hypothetical protein
MRDSRVVFAGNVVWPPQLTRQPTKSLTPWNTTSSFAFKPSQVKIFFLSENIDLCATVLLSRLHQHHLCLIPEFSPKLALQNACVAARQEIDELKHIFDVCPFHLFLFSADSCARQHGVTHNRVSARRAWTSHTATPCVLLTSENSIELLKKCRSEGITEFGDRSVVISVQQSFPILIPSIAASIVLHGDNCLPACFFSLACASASKSFFHLRWLKARNPKNSPLWYSPVGGAGRGGLSQTLNPDFSKSEDIPLRSRAGMSIRIFPGFSKSKEISSQSWDVPGFCGEGDAPRDDCHALTVASILNQSSARPSILLEG